ncbi:sll0787 family AIR synthase-like protein [Salipiger mucosus]|uniref:Selenophosphate synthetase-related protein n=1 Tax=Salipiger mucosus DSM 16094 TaxID=1123237 RepID=S9QV73_9RHOB|nr:sll0787 family AIR synthase-like protein [Salipiger mucosus]EPX85301.1 Selenophosphate synthetase-related protein [Salipiger mucosus DSM 16094]
MSLETLAEELRAHPSIRSKLGIAHATRTLGLDAASEGSPGDDAAPLARDGGYDLLAGEGFIPGFVEDDPWFAGWCAMMVNLSDIAAMGGRSVALIDQVWAPDQATAAPLLQGLRDASAAYGVPVVGGHTNLAAPQLGIAASVFGRAERLVTSFDAAPGDVLIAAIDHRGRYRNFDNFCAALDAPGPRLRGDLALLPALAEDGLIRAGKDISQGGIVGTALMLAECSGVGIDIDTGALRPPPGVPLHRWLRSFPSFGFLLSVEPSDVGAVCQRFAHRGIEAAAIGSVTQGSALRLTGETGAATFWDHAATPYLDLGGPHA